MPSSSPRGSAPSPWLVAVAVLVALVLVAAACAGGETFGVNGGGTGPPTTGSPSGSTQAAPAGGDGATTTAVVEGTEPPPASTSQPAPTDPLQGLALEVVATGLHQPTVVTSPDGDPRVFVVERQGVIRIVDPGTGLREEAFLDLRDRVGSNGIEQGLLGLDFHPRYAENGRLFVYFITMDGSRRLSEFTVGNDPDRGDPDSERVLFEFPQPPGATDIRHYAGMVLFGPDGLLYVSLGDGADSRNQGQNPDTPYGTVVRIDVDSGDPYAVPAGNPFPDGGAPEVWVYGLRNPWRFHIDSVDGLMYIADVGQGDWEEINVAPLDGGGGTNFGWADTEGHTCYLKTDCNTDDYTMPVFEYDHDQGCSISGGVVYRGTAMPELAGHFFYADWCGMWVHSLRYQDGQVTDQQDWSSDLPDAGQVNAFGTDADGEMYLTNFDGAVAKIVPQR